MPQQELQQVDKVKHPQIKTLTLQLEQKEQLLKPTTRMMPTMMMMTKQVVPQLEDNIKPQQVKMLR
jgi:hypothetical protein